MYFVRSGFVDLVMDGAVVDTIPPGGYFGEVALLTLPSKDELLKVHQLLNLYIHLSHTQCHTPPTTLPCSDVAVLLCGSTLMGVGAICLRSGLFYFSFRQNSISLPFAPGRGGAIGTHGLLRTPVVMPCTYLDRDLGTTLPGIPWDTYNPVRCGVRQ